MEKEKGKKESSFTLLVGSEKRKILYSEYSHTFSYFAIYSINNFFGCVGCWNQTFVGQWRAWRLQEDMIRRREEMARRSDPPS